MTTNTNTTNTNSTNTINTVEGLVALYVAGRDACVELTREQAWAAAKYLRTVGLGREADALINAGGGRPRFAALEAATEYLADFGDLLWEHDNPEAAAEMPSVTTTAGLLARCHKAYTDAASGDSIAADAADAARAMADEAITMARRSGRAIDADNAYRCALLAHNAAIAADLQGTPLFDFEGLPQWDADAWRRAAWELGLLTETEPEPDPEPTSPAPAPTDEPAAAMEPLYRGSDGRASLSPNGRRSSWTAEARMFRAATEAYRAAESRKAAIKAALDAQGVDSRWAVVAGAEDASGLDALAELARQGYSLVDQASDLLDAIVASDASPDWVVEAAQDLQPDVGSLDLWLESMLYTIQGAGQGVTDFELCGHCGHELGPDGGCYHPACPNCDIDWPTETTSPAPAPVAVATAVAPIAHGAPSAPAPAPAPAPTIDAPTDESAIERRELHCAVRDLPTAGNFGHARRVLQDAGLREVRVIITGNVDGLGCTYHDHRAASVWMWDADGAEASWSGSYGGSYAMTYSQGVEAAAAGGKVGGPLPQGAMALQIERGGSWAKTAALYVRPETVNASSLGQVGQELDDAARKALGFYKSYLPAYRRDALKACSYNRAMEDMLVAGGYLKRDKAGRCRITPAGKNAAADVM